MSEKAGLKGQTKPPSRQSARPLDSWKDLAAPPIGDILLKGIWQDHPMLLLTLALCPAVALSGTLAGGLAVGITVLFVLVLASFCMAVAREFVPGHLRIFTGLSIIGVFVNVAGGAMQAVSFELHTALAPCLPLLAVSAIVLGSAEAFSPSHGASVCVLHALKNGARFLAAVLVLSALRECLGTASLLGHSLPGIVPWGVFAHPAGGYLLLGGALLAYETWQHRRQEQVPAAAPKVKP